MPANLDPADPAARQWLNDHTIIFDFSNLPPDDEELAARQALRQLRHTFRARRRTKPASTPPPFLPAPSSLESAPSPVAPPPHPEITPPVVNSNPVQQSGRLDPNTINAPREVNEMKPKRGGQPGNNNALKYGFYSRRMPVRELEGLDQTTVTSLKDEIDVMRVFSRKVAELGADIHELNDAKDLLRVLSLATTSINRLVRTHTRIPDPDLDPAQLLRTALLELEDEWPEFKAFADQFRDKPTANRSGDQPPAQVQP